MSSSARRPRAEAKDLWRGSPGSGSFDDRTVFELDVIGNSINYSQDANFEYFPTSYQTGTYDQKWIDKLCVQNYDAGAVFSEVYSQAERLQKSTEVKTMGNTTWNGLEAHLSTNVVGVVHIGWSLQGDQAQREGEIRAAGQEHGGCSGRLLYRKVHRDAAERHGLWAGDGVDAVRLSGIDINKNL